VAAALALARPARAPCCSPSSCGFRAATAAIALPGATKAAIERLLDTNARVVAVSFGSPYILRDLPRLPTYLCAWGSQPDMQMAAALALFGETPITGRLPVTIPGLAPRGAGLQKTRLLSDPLSPAGEGGGFGCAVATRRQRSVKPGCDRKSSGRGPSHAPAQRAAAGRGGRTYEPPMIRSPRARARRPGFARRPRRRAPRAHRRRRDRVNRQPRAPGRRRSSSATGGKSFSRRRTATARSSPSPSPMTVDTVFRRRLADENGGDRDRR
jgi:hypothetical protein